MVAPVVRSLRDRTEWGTAWKLRSQATLHVRHRALGATAGPSSVPETRSATTWVGWPCRPAKLPRLRSTDARRPAANTRLFWKIRHRFCYTHVFRLATAFGFRAASPSQARVSLFSDRQ